MISETALIQFGRKFGISTMCLRLVFNESKVSVKNSFVADFLKVIAFLTLQKQQNSETLSKVFVQKLIASEVRERSRD